jgi:hypothetical protein
MDMITYAILRKQLNNDVDELNEKIAEVRSAAITRSIVDELPVEDIKDNVIYMVPMSGEEEDDYYDEYMYINSKWETIGHTKVDLEDYALKTDIPTELSELNDDATHRLVTDSEKNTWNAKQDALTAEQLDAINSGVTSEKLEQMDATIDAKANSADVYTKEDTDELLDKKENSFTYDPSTEMLNY